MILRFTIQHNHLLFHTVTDSILNIMEKKVYIFMKMVKRICCFFEYTDTFVFDSVQIHLCSQCVIKPQTTTTTNLLKLTEER